MPEALPRPASHVYTLKEGDVWTIFNHHLVIANPDHPPFMIDLATGERKELHAIPRPAPI